MKKRIVNIDKKLCNGCGACALACHEGAIEMIDGKAELTRKDFCDGLGDCIGACPVNAIVFADADASDDSSRNKRKQTNQSTYRSSQVPSQLMQWPCQIKLVPVNAPYFDGADLLVAADCTAFSYGNFHNDFMKNRITLIGCPKLDSTDYSEKLTSIIKNNNIKSIQVLRMEVMCCSGLELACKKALAASGKVIPITVTTVTTDGKLAE